MSAPGPIDPVQRVAAALALLLDLEGKDLTDPTPEGLVATLRPRVAEVTRELARVEADRSLSGEDHRCARLERFAIDRTADLLDALAARRARRATSC